jgi:hypothetical protein
MWGKHKQSSVLARICEKERQDGQLIGMGKECRGKEGRK